jgi:hypothetical protein
VTLTLNIEDKSGRETSGIDSKLTQELSVFRSVEPAKEELLLLRGSNGAEVVQVLLSLAREDDSGDELLVGSGQSLPVSGANLVDQRKHTVANPSINIVLSHLAGVDLGLIVVKENDGLLEVLAGDCLQNGGIRCGTKLNLIAVSGGNVLKGSLKV